MITAKMLQKQYNKLYVNFRRYIWPFEVAKRLAELEASCYSAFPDIETIKKHLYTLESYCKNYIDDSDEDLFSSFDEFKELLDSADTIYAKLQKRNSEVE